MATSSIGITILDEWRPTEVSATLLADRIFVSAADLAAAMGWEAKPEGFCRGAVCVPNSKGEAVATSRGIDLAGFAELLGRPLAVDLDDRVAALGASAQDRGAALSMLDAPDFTLPDLSGKPHSISDFRGRKLLLAAFSSWCGCRGDLPGWQALFDELRDFGFGVMAVAFDKDPEEVRPWIELANPSYPCVIDSRHLVADLYNMVNVPTILWIDEQGRIVRPNDVAFGDNTWQHITHLDAATHARALRAWVRGERPAYSADKVRSLQKLPTPRDQLARAEFIVGQWLFERGRPRRPGISKKPAKSRRTISRFGAAPWRCADSIRLGPISSR